MLVEFGVFLARAARDFFKDFDVLAAKIPKIRSPAGAVCGSEGVLAALRERGSNLDAVAEKLGLGPLSRSKPRARNLAYSWTRRIPISEHSQSVTDLSDYPSTVTRT